MAASLSTRTAPSSIAVAALLLVACGAGGEAGPTPSASGTADDAAQTTVTAAQDTTATPAETTTVTPARTVEVSERVQYRFDMPHVDYLAEAGGAVWVKEDRGPLHRIDPATNDVVASVEVEVAGETPCAGIGGLDNILWVCAGGGQVARVDTTTNEVVATVDAGKLFDQGPIPIAFDHAWVIADGGTSLVGVSNDTNEVALTHPLPARCTNVAAGPDALWIACRPDAVVLRVDPVSGAVVSRLESFRGPAAIAFDRAVWVGHEGGTSRLDPDTGTVTGAVDVGPGSHNGYLYAVDGDVWIRGEDFFLKRLDGTSLELIEEVTAPERSGGSVMLAFGSVWATAYSDGVLYRLSPGPE